MSLFGAARGIADLQNQTRIVGNARKQIFDIRDRLRGTPQFSQIFYNLISDVSHPPMQIIGNYTDNSFWTVGWQTEYGAYEPFSTVKYQDVNIGYIEICAIFLLLQECYPNMYDFPNRTTTQIAEGVPCELNMKKAFVGKGVRPAAVPAPVQSAPAAPSRQPQAVPQAAVASFCSNCGNKLSGNEKFCPVCGNKV